MRILLIFLFCLSCLMFDGFVVFTERMQLLGRRVLESCVFEDDTSFFLWCHIFRVHAILSTA